MPPKKRVNDNESKSHIKRRKKKNDESDSDLLGEFGDSADNGAEVVSEDYVDIVSHTERLFVMILHDRLP